MTRNTILLIEDNPDHALLSIEALESVHAGTIDVQVVDDGQQALDFLYRAEGYEDVARPGLILLDIQLPAVGGFEVLEKIKADEDLRLIPAVMLTSSDAPEDVARSYTLGSNSYVTKPVGAEDLFDRLAQLPDYWFGVNTAVDLP